MAFTPEQSQPTLAALKPPVAARIPHPVFFGKVEGEERGEKSMDPPIVREDPYFWIRDSERKDPAMIHYLNAENNYYKGVCEQIGVSPLESAMEKELLSHYKEEDVQVPTADGDWFYYSRTVKGQGYPFHCRRRRIRTTNASSPVPPRATKVTGEINFDFFPQTGVIDDVEEEILFDVNELAKGNANYYFGDYEASTKHLIMAYSVDLKGDEIFDVHFKAAGNNIKEVAEDPRKSNIESVKEVLHGCERTMKWDHQDRRLFYLSLNVELRPTKLWVHRLGTAQSEDVCIYEEKDPEFRLSLESTHSRRFIFLESYASDSSEIRLLDLESLSSDASDDDLKSSLVLIAGRHTDHRYTGDHQGEHFWFVSNMDGCTENKLVIAPLKSSDPSTWREVIKYNEAINLKEVTCFEDFVVVEGLQKGLEQIWVLKAKDVLKRLESGTSIDLSDPADMEASGIYKIGMADESYSCGLRGNSEFQTTILRFRYTSLTTPEQIIDFDMATKERRILKTHEVPNFKQEDYDSKRITAPSHDGGRVNVPISLVWRRSDFPDGIDNLATPAPLILEGYGSYGFSSTPRFNFQILPYLNRGFVYAIAHIRGGGDMGRYWYEREGKYLNKKNTFYDFATCAEYLQKKGITARDRTGIVGRSAGGLLIGATINLRPELFAAAIAGVPFVDVMNTMSDPSIPLTTEEWQEWGNPNQMEFYHYMLEYSPYDNVRHQRYPHLLVLAGLHDPRVAYWEPAKWVAKLRATKTDNNLLLLKTDMSAGHFSAADRYKYIKEKSLEVAFFIHTLQQSLKQ